MDYAYVAALRGYGPMGPGKVGIVLQIAMLVVLVGIIILGYQTRQRIKNWAKKRKQNHK